VAISEAPEPAALLESLFDDGLLIASGVPGVYGHGPRFEHARAALERRLSSEARSRGAELLRFPPLLPRVQLEDSGYLGSFPHLVGTIFSFDGDERQAGEQAERAAAREDWSEHQRMSDLTLMPAACYPVYPAVAARPPLPPGGTFVDAGGAWVFRHEPSEDPARRQIFHQHELVRLGEPDTVLAWREEWAAFGLELMRRLGLRAQLEVANDPFFGRRGRLLARSQREQALKLEIQVPITSLGPTAVASFNHHREHFAERYGIVMHDGSAAHTACLGFGHERIVLALLVAHGFDPDRWPPEVRGELWP
jgi:seryl-tRNA synthetase